MERLNVLRIAMTALGIGVLVASGIYFEDNYMLWSFVILSIAILPFFVRFENRKVDTKYIVLICILASVSAVGRLIFAPIPSFKPTSFVIIISGIVFGGEAGFMIGAMSAIVSNIFFGQGPWTPWQMFCWGMMGLTSGLIGNRWLLKNTFGKVIFGFMWGFLFGWIMNIWNMISVGGGFSKEIIISTFIASFYFDLTHAMSNVIFLGLFSKSWIKSLDRIKTKYDLKI